MTEASTADRRDTLIGLQLAGKYVIERQLGAGAMASVYLARQIALDKAVAIKVMHPELQANAAFAERFHREAKAASRLDHPNSIRIMDYGESAGVLYIAMEYCDGRDLFTVLQEEVLGPTRIVELLSQALAALAVAHDMGVLHRDLKPENVMVLRGTSDDGQPTDIVKVCDFGIAKILEIDEKAVAADARKLSWLELAVGTPHYMSPEQARGDEVDARSDLYAMGVVLYQLLTGRTPFEGSPVRVMVKQISEAPPPPHAMRPDVHRGLENVCLKAMQKDSNLRYSSAREMRAALREAIGLGSYPSVTLRVQSDAVDSARTLQVGAPAPPARRPAFAGLGIAALGLATVLAVAGVGLRYARSVRTPTAQGAAQPKAADVPSAMPADMTPVAVAATVEQPDPVATAAAPEADTRRAPPQRIASRAKPSVPLPATTPVVSATPPIANTAVDPPAPPSATAVAINAAAPGASPPPPPIVASPAPAPSPAPVLAASAEIVVGVAQDPIGATSANVSRIVAPLAPRFTSCYRAALGRGAAGVVGGSGLLHMETDDDGVIIEARYTGPLRDAMGACVTQAVRGRRIPNVDTGTASVDVPLTLRTR